MAPYMSRSESFQDRDERQMKDKKGRSRDDNPVSDQNGSPLIPKEITGAKNISEDINTRERRAHGRKRKVVELDGVGEDSNLIKSSRSNGRRHHSNPSFQDHNTNVGITEAIEPVETRLLAALQQELGISTETTSSLQLLSNTQATIHFRHSQRNSVPPTDGATSTLEYRNNFPPEDVAALQEHEWQILEHVITYRKFGLKNPSALRKRGRPSSAAIDEMISHLSGTTKTTCLKFREQQKEIWRRGQRKFRAAEHTNQSPSTLDNDNGATQSHAAKKASVAKGSGTQNNASTGQNQPRINGNHRQDLPSRPVEHHMVQSQNRIPPLIARHSYLPSHETNERRAGTAIIPTEQNFPNPPNGLSMFYSPGQRGKTRLPILNLQYRNTLPEIALPLSVTEQARIKLWLMRKD